MKTVVAALIAGVSLMLSAAPSAAQDPFDDAIAMMETDPVEALAALENLARAGDNEAVNAVASIIDNPPDGVPRDQARARRLWEQAVAGGSDAARLNLGMNLLENDDPTDDAHAVSMLQAIRNPELMPVAAYPLGRALLFGNGIAQDMERGVRLLERFIETSPDNTDARYLVGRAYQNGWGIAVDAPTAYQHLKHAADGNDPRAQWIVGMMLLNGDGVAQNPVLAYRHVRASAESGHIPGMVSMAVMLAVGQGTDRDPAQARQWYLRAAEAGSAHALRGLGGMLMTGEGGPVDAVTGAAYLDLAAKTGDDLAVTLQQRFQLEIATLDPAAVEAVKSHWLRSHGIPR